MFSSRGGGRVSAGNADRSTCLGHWALGIGHWALGIGHWALGIGHGLFSLSLYYPHSPLPTPYSPHFCNFTTQSSAL
ncbi:hypothetical protein FM036_18520 [Nostoc sp. HG1]|nr:hypothetical protein [Nostoc sp. HG1]